jgi:hypothetical protein
MMHSNNEVSLGEGNMKKFVFSDMRQEIIEELEKLIKNDKARIEEKVGLVDGFVKDPVSNELTSDIIIGGPMVPMVMLVGEETGRVYLFALKILLKMDQ